MENLFLALMFLSAYLFFQFIGSLNATVRVVGKSHETRFTKLILPWVVQFCLCCLIAGGALLFFGLPFMGLAFFITAFLPPIAILWLFEPMVLVAVFPVWCGAALLFSLSARTRLWAVMLSVFVTAFSLPVTTNWYWDRQMCRSAASLGLTDIQRPSFLYNLSRIHTKYGREPYATAKGSDGIWDWGYDKSTFVYFSDQPTRFSNTEAFRLLNCLN